MDPYPCWIYSFWTCTCRRLCFSPMEHDNLNTTCIPLELPWNLHSDPLVWLIAAVNLDQSKNNASLPWMLVGAPLAELDSHECCLMYARSNRYYHWTLLSLELSLWPNLFWPDFIFLMTLTSSLKLRRWTHACSPWISCFYCYCYYWPKITLDIIPSQPQEILLLYTHGTLCHSHELQPNQRSDPRTS